MAEAEKSVLNDSSLSVTLTVGQLKTLVREEIKKAVGLNGHQGDKLLDAEEACKVLSASPDWLYRHATRLPFTRKLGPRMLRFSHQGIQKWLASRRTS